MSRPTFTNYTEAELLTVLVSRDLEDDGHGFIGLGTGGPAFTRAVVSLPSPPSSRVVSAVSIS